VNSASIARYTSRAGLIFPAFAILAFLADGPLSKILDLTGSSGAVSNFSVLRNQYLFLERQGLADAYLGFDFQIFEFFIWLAALLCTTRIVFAVFSSSVLDSFELVAEQVKAKNRSNRGFIIFFIGVGFLTMIFATNFSVTAHSDQMRSLMAHAPHAFVCLCVMLFCWGAVFFTEGWLFVAFLIRERFKTDGRTRT
jgi:hypothetical protein